MGGAQGYKLIELQKAYWSMLAIAYLKLNRYIVSLCVYLSVRTVYFFLVTFSHNYA